MGTRTGMWIVVLCVVLGLGLSALAWADEEAVVAAPAAPLMVAQGPEMAPVVAPACPPELLGVTQNARGTTYYYEDRSLTAWATIGSARGAAPQSAGGLRAVRQSDCEGDGERRAGSRLRDHPVPGDAGRHDSRGR